MVRAGGVVTVLGGVPAAVRPLRHRDFRLLWTGLAVSLVGSGLWLVALAWQVIELGGGPTELSLVTALFSVGLLAFVLIGGVAADRLPQRLVMLAADLVRAAVLLVLGLLSLSGNLEIWHLAAGGLVIGAGEAFFIPSYTALLPRLLPEEELLAANGLEGTLRPLAQQAAGPALGGVAVAALSPGVAILTGGLAYLVSAGCLLAMKVRPRKVPLRTVPPASRWSSPTCAKASATCEGRAGCGRRSCLRWPSYCSSSVRWRCCCLSRSAITSEAGPRTTVWPWLRSGWRGVGALAISSGRLPRRYLTVMILMWGLGSLPFAVIGVAGALWVVCVALFIVGATYSAAMVIWGTLLQRRVPEGLRGRVSSLDFFVSLALMPVSMAIAGPAGAIFGITAVFIIAGIVPVLPRRRGHSDPQTRPRRTDHPLDHPESAPAKNVSGSTQNEPKGSELL